MRDPKRVKRTLLWLDLATIASMCGVGVVAALWPRSWATVIPAIPGIVATITAYVIRRKDWAEYLRDKE